jgi:hypothetical protein
MTESIEPRRHRAVPSLLSTHFLPSGVLTPEDIAIVWREPQDAAALTEQVLAAYGIPYALTRRVPLGHTALGRGLIALARCAEDDATADDLLTWLRTPGFLRHAWLADDLEQEARKTGARTAQAARELWEERHPTFPLEAIDEVRREAQRGAAALCRRLAREAARLFSAPFAREAPVFTGAERLVHGRHRQRPLPDRLGRAVQAPLRQPGVCWSRMFLILWLGAIFT